MTAYYNEIDPYAAQWLRNLIKAGHIAPGYVDERSIVDVRADELRGYDQCHFFAGVGVWSYALRKAGWPDDRRVWTGSCPCQPFSAAGRAGGFGDERHLWPHWAGLIGECRPDALFGEQVASADGLAWLDFVCADLEAAGYAVGALDTCAAGVGAPHIRQRLYFVADAGGARIRDSQPGNHADSAGIAGREAGQQRLRDDAGNDGGSSGPGELADADGRNPGAEGLQRSGEHGRIAQDGGADRMEHPESDGREQRRPEPSGRGAAGGCGEGGIVGHAPGPGLQGAIFKPGSGGSPQGEGQANILLGSATNGFWSDCDWLPCIDGKARPVEPGTFPLAHGAPARVGRLRAYGNAINAEAARHFIESYMSRLELAPECIPLELSSDKDKGTP